MNTKFIYLIPTFQNPSGITTSLKKRKACYELAKKFGVMILEDNPYSDLRVHTKTNAAVPVGTVAFSDGTAGEDSHRPLFRLRLF